VNRCRANLVKQIMRSIPVSRLDNGGLIGNGKRIERVKEEIVIRTL
jgi:hypothetical protein